MKFRPNADMAASVLVHLLVLALIFLFSEVHQFDPVAADTVPVEVVTPQEVAEIKPDPVPSPTPTPDFQLPSLDKPTEAKPEAAKSESSKPEATKPEAEKPEAEKPEAAVPAPAPSPTPQLQQKQATPPAPKPSPTPQETAAAEPASAPQTPPVPQQPPVYGQPQPDLTVKYNVMLGLPPDISLQTPPAAPSGPGPGKDNFDAAATEQADIGSSVVAEFRRHLKTCMKLPASLSTSDDVRVKLRVFMKPDGKLAAAPQLIEATASAKGPLLLQGATQALQACEPYAMLPKDRYGEWKVLDLDFTPRDFAS